LFHFLNFIFTLFIFAIYLVMALISGIEMVTAKITILFVGFFATLLFSWLPVVNPIVSIWINRPYRDAVRKFIGRILRKTSTATTATVHPFNQ
jgi:hypothetical protein